MGRPPYNVVIHNIVNNERVYMGGSTRPKLNYLRTTS
jgi:hypothetical protein